MRHRSIQHNAWHSAGTAHDERCMELLNCPTNTELTFDDAMSMDVRMRCLVPGGEVLVVKTDIPDREGYGPGDWHAGLFFETGNVYYAYNIGYIDHLPDYEEVDNHMEFLQTMAEQERSMLEEQDSTCAP